MNTFNAIVALLSIILGFTGVFLTFVTFFSPEIVKNWALKKSKHWIPVPAIKYENKMYRHKVFSGFTIEVEYSEPVSEDDFFEDWMRALHRPDRSATSYHVTMFFNGLPLDRMLFLQYDGGRNFIPVPTRDVVGDRLYVVFSEKQKKFADIVGYDYFGRPFSEVITSITKSKYNPTYFNLSLDGLPERLEKLQVDIDSFKSRRSAA